MRFKRIGAGRQHETNQRKHKHPRHIRGTLHHANAMLTLSQAFSCESHPNSNYLIRADLMTVNAELSQAKYGGGKFRPLPEIRHQAMPTTEP